MTHWHRGPNDAGIMQSANDNFGATLMTLTRAAGKQDEVINKAPRGDELAAVL